ncbi:unnamed protein product [Rotaria sp. Silwood2]|nr:unnamed protein product [Rotaria sp. Silwood2]CAF2546947.1 unnamed protein product [Rotaria sp. Silwood2]CAF4456382.1 unnamed protein product [Rotaria sp. Silwood2]
MERYSQLIHVTQNRVNGSAVALNETKRRTQEMVALNEQMEKTIQKIPVSIPKTETTTSIERSAWLPWRKTTSTRITSSMILPEKLAAIQREINSLNDRLIDIDKEANEATNTIGHHGNTLVQCLTDVRILAKAINNGATAYTPLVSALKAVRTSVDAQIELLMSKNPTDIFLGGNQLLRQVECLGHYHTCATKCLEPPQEYNNITIKEKLKAIEMS